MPAPAPVAIGIDLTKLAHKSSLLFYIIFFLLGFLTYVKYNYSIENWVWQCWESLGGAQTRASVVAACNLTSSLYLSLISSVDISQGRVP